MEAWATWGNQSGSFRPRVRPSSSPAAHTWFSTQRHKHRRCDSQTHSSHRRTISPHVFIKILMVLHTHGTHLTCTADTHFVHHTTTDSEVSHTHSCLRPLTRAATGRGRAFKFPHNAGPNVPHCSRIHKPPTPPGHRHTVRRQAWSSHLQLRTGPVHTERRERKRQPVRTGR